MPVNIGPRIGIDGEKEFRQNLNSISQQLKTLGTEMKAVTSAFDANDKSQENLANQSQVLTEQLSLQEKRIAEIQKALDHARSNYAENSNQVQRWQQAMNNAVAELNKTRSQLSKVQSEMDGASDSTQDMSDALNDVDGAAEKASSGISSMTVAMGNLISSGIQAAASAVADLVSSLWNLDESTEEYRESQARLNAAFENSGLSTNSAEKAYEELYSVMGETDTAVEAAQQISLLAESEKDVEKWSRLAAGVVGQFGDALQPETFFESANETLKLGEATGAYTQMLEGAGVNVDEFNSQLAACNTEQEKQSLLLETAESILSGAGDAYREYAGDIISANTSQAQLDKVMGNLGATISNLKNSLMNELTPALTGVVDAFNGLLTGAPGATEAFTQAIQGLITTGAEMLPQFLDTGLQIVVSMVNGIVQALPDLAQAGIEIIGQVVTTITENLPQILDLGLQVLDQLTSGIESGLPDMVSRIPQIITEFLDYLTGELPTILEKGVEILNNLVDGIIESIPDMVAALPEIITAFTQFVATNLPKIIAAGVDILLNLLKGILNAIPELVENLPQLINAIIDGIGNLMGGIVDVGKEIVRGIWDGISAMASWIKSKVTDFFSGIVDGVKGLLGINSPSKVFADMGENMALGLGEGFAGEMRGVQRQIDRSMAGLVAPTMTYGVTAATSAPVYSGGDTIGAAVGAAVRSALDGAAVYLNGRKVGNLITQQQNQTAIARGQSPVYI